MDRLARIALLTVIFGTFTCATVAMGQNTNSGDIRGTVTDPSGAIVPGANVTVTNEETGVVSRFVTNSDGLYDTNAILPGTYTITFSKPGFETLAKTHIILAVGIITVDGQLKVGLTTQEITVTSTLPALKTENAEQSTDLDQHAVDSLPMTNPRGYWTQFVQLLPGSSGTTGGPGSGSGDPGVDQAIEGTAPYFSSYLIDGGSIRLPASANIDEENNEAIAEVQVVAMNASAQYGGGGNVFNLISKTGTNKFHGAAYDYVQNDDFDARDEFNSTGRKGRVRYNYFGGSLGGPVIKEKLFFYFDYEQLKNPQTSTSTITMPTQAMRAGCFDPAIFGSDLTLDPAHGSTPLTTNVAQCGAYNAADLAIPTADMDPVALKMQSYFVNPTNPSLLANNYTYLQSTPNRDRKEFIRLDYDLSTKNRVNTTLTARASPETIGGETAICPIQCQTSRSTGWTGQISDVYTFSSNVVNEFRFSAVRQGNWFVPESEGKGLISAIGLQYAVADVFPDVTIGGVGGNSTFNAGDDTSAIFVENAFTYSDVLTLIRGKHILHFGGELMRDDNNSTPWGNLHSAQFTFTGQYTTSNPAVEVGYADFLLGDVQSWSALNQPDNGTRSWNPSFFAQDDIKVRPNLTVNLGLRWEIHGGFYNQFNQAGGFDPTLINPITNTPGSIWFAGLNGERTHAFKTQYDAVLPRVGVAWTMSDKWVVRGAVGEYSALWSSDTAGGNIGFGDAILGSANAAPGQPPVVQLSGTGANLTLVSHDRNPADYNGQGNGYIPYMPYNLKPMLGWQWNGGIQRRLPGNMVLEATYVGSHWNNLMFITDDNQVPADKLGGGQAARPYPQYLGIGPGSGGARTGNYNGISNYNALQIQLNRPTTHGLYLTANYTYSRMKDDMDSSGWGEQFGGIYWQDAYNISSNYGLSNFNTPNAFKAAAVYSIPLGKGHQYLTSGAGDAVLGGWQASTIVVAQSGVPITMVMSSATPDGALDGSWYPNLVGNAKVSNRTINNWFNQLAFAQPADNTFGTLTRNSPLYGPNLVNCNFSLGKSFSIPGWEQGKISIRMDARNIFNHQSFSLPNNNLNPVALATGVPDPSVGRISGTTVTGRIIQLSARFSF